jgi:simple sugar transport system substrate-binding protein
MRKMIGPSRARSSARAIALGGVLTVGLATAGFATAGYAKSDSPTTSGKGSVTAVASSAVSAPYNGSESKLPASYGQPVKKKGVKCVIGYDNALAAIPELLVEQQGAAAAAKKLGCTFDAYDAQGSPTTQVANYNDMLVKHINILISYPNDPKALGPELAKAKQQGVIIMSNDTPGIVGEPLETDAASEVIQGWDKDAYDTAQAIAQKKPGARLGVIGYAAPIPSLNFYVKRFIYYAKKLGLKYVGQVDEAASGTPQAASVAAQALYGKYSNLQAVMGFNDVTSEAAVAQARQQGLHLLITGSNGESAAIQEVKSGALLSDFYFNAAAIGKQLVWGAYDKLTKQHLPLPKIVDPTDVLLTKSNASSVTPIG